MEQIQEFNRALLTVSDITIIEYARKLNDKFFKIDISFIDDFMGLVGKDECCIHHDMLVKYGILTLSSGTTDVSRMLKQNDFTEKQDYQVASLQRCGLPSQTNYHLKPKTFKFLLMRSLKTTKYANYYLLLEQAIAYYNEFQIMKLQSELNEVKKDRILKLPNHEDNHDNFFVVKRNPRVEFTWVYKKQQGEWIKRVDSVFNYVMIRGSLTNINVVMRRLKQESEVSDDDVILALKMPHANNFVKRILQDLKHVIRFQRVYIEIKEEEDDELIESRRVVVEDNETFGVYEDDENYRYINHTKLFRLNGVNEQEFITKLCQIDKERFE